MPVHYESQPTLVKPPPAESDRAEIENILELTQLTDIDPVRSDLFGIDRIRTLTGEFRIYSPTLDRYGTPQEREVYTVAL